DRVQAVTLSGRGWPVREHVAEVTTAALAADLGAHHPVAAVDELLDVPGRIALVEARPARPRVELRRRAVQGKSAEAAHVDAALLVVEQRPAEGRLGSLEEKHAALFGIEGLREIVDDLARETGDVVAGAGGGWHRITFPRAHREGKRIRRRATRSP